MSSSPMGSRASAGTRIGIDFVEHDNRNLASPGLFRIFGEARLLGHHALPNAFALAGSGGLGTSGVAPSLDLDGNARIPAQILVPRGVHGASAGRREYHAIRSVVEVHERNRPLLSALASSRRQQEHAPSEHR